MYKMYLKRGKSMKIIQIFGNKLQVVIFWLILFHVDILTITSLLYLI